MYSHENTKIRNKRIRRDRKYKLVRKTLAITGAIIVIATSGSTLLMKSGALEPAPQIIISKYYGEDSKEYDVVSYIELSKELEKLELEKYEITPNLYEKYNISNELKRPEEINELISKIRFMNAFVSSKNITKQSENIEIVLNLVKQKNLVNEYIYQMGYEIALNDIDQSLKEYSGEVFGVEGENLKFEHKFENSSGDNRIDIESGNKKYKKRVFSNDAEKDMRKGIEALEQTRNAYNTYGLEYAKERNNSILNALKVSAQLSEKKDENDLYNEKMASRLR